VRDAFLCLLGGRLHITISYFFLINLFYNSINKKTINDSEKASSSIIPNWQYT